MTWKDGVNTFAIENLGEDIGNPIFHRYMLYMAYQSMESEKTWEEIDGEVRDIAHPLLPLTGFAPVKGSNPVSPI
jgi:hypothetical protein